jgi:hypothetical protein
LETTQTLLEREAEADAIKREISEAEDAFDMLARACEAGRAVIDRAMAH